jgi:hypothetical protein
VTHGCGITSSPPSNSNDQMFLRPISWPSPADGLREIRRVLCEGGTLLLCLRVKHPTRSLWVAPGYTANEIARVAQLVRDVGFHNVRVLPGNAGREVACVEADR